MTDLQKASLTKRFAAGLLDAMLLCVLAVGIAALLTWLLGYNAHADAVKAGRQKYSEKYGVNLNIEKQEYDALSSEQRGQIDAAFAAMIADEDLNYYQHYSMMESLLILITTFSILLAMLILEFAVPLVLKNGQTFGKKAFSLGLMRTDGVQITPVQLFARTVLGKFTIETMVSVYIIILIFAKYMGTVGLVVVGGILLIQLICLAVTRTHSLIHDLLAVTVVVDISSQKIFRTTEDLMEFQKKIAAERAARQEY